MEVHDLKETPPWQWPALRNRRNSDSDRLIAADPAGDPGVMDDRMAKVLLTIVRRSDEPDELPAQAAIAFGAVLELPDIEDFVADDLSEPAISKDTSDAIQETRQGLYDDQGTSKELRRRAPEASVRAPQDWHPDAIRAAYCSGDQEWRLTAAFRTRWVRGFDEQIPGFLESSDPDIQYEAVLAAGHHELDAALPHVAALLTSRETGKSLRLAAIEAAGSLRPSEAIPIPSELADSDDEDICDAADDAPTIAQGSREYDDSDDDEDDDK